ncbi:hypothetical protein H0W32_03195 [Patescibacteria group bacterium]|nr:hypothetical protein [Patescibacteria group bacterium]
MSNLVNHARRELALLNNDSEFNDCIVKAVEAFAAYGHSGGSAGVGIDILNRLLQFQNLTPLTDNPNEWFHHTGEHVMDSEGVWQSVRRGEAFSTDGGKTFYLLSDGSTQNNVKKVYISDSSDKAAQTLITKDKK